MSKFYELLKKKAEDETKKDEVVIVGRGVVNDLSINYNAMTYSDLLWYVDKYIEIFKDPEYSPGTVPGGRKYIVVDNSINSIASIIALLECGVTPVIIDAKNIPNIDEKKLPFLDFGDYVADSKRENMLLYQYLCSIDGIEKPLPGELQPGNKLVICSSGSEGSRPHLNVAFEDDLIKLPNQYGENSGVFFSYISCANISGILTNLVNFLVHDVKLMLSKDFTFDSPYFSNDLDEFVKKSLSNKYEEKRYFASTGNPALMKLLFLNKSSYDGYYYDQIHIEGDELVLKEKREDYQIISYNDLFEKEFKNGTLSKVDTMMFPRNIIRFLENTDLSGLDFSSLRHIYLSGGINSEDVVIKVRQKIPSIPKGVFTNLYGSTEANGVMCTCDEKDFRTCYINVGDYESGKISYTFDKEQFFEIDNGNIKEIPKPNDLFEYMPYLTASSKKEDSLTIDDKLGIKYKGQPTGDIGIYIEDQLYVLGRKSDLINLKGRTYITHALESYYSKEIGSKVYVRQVDDEAIQIFMKESPLKVSEDFYRRYVKGLDIAKNTKRYHVNIPVVIDDYVFPESKISGKITKQYLDIFLNRAREQYDAIMQFPSSMEFKSKQFAECLANYEPKVLEDGTFLIAFPDRLALPINDMINVFYAPMLTNHNDCVRYIPKPEIIFFTDEHMLFSNRLTKLVYNDTIVDAVMKEALEAKKSGKDVLEMYKPLDKNLTGEALINQLKDNIMSDVTRRYINKRIPQRMLESLSPEEREIIKNKLNIKKEKNDNEQRDSNEESKSNESDIKKPKIKK